MPCYTSFSTSYNHKVNNFEIRFYLDIRQCYIFVKNMILRMDIYIYIRYTEYFRVTCIGIKCEINLNKSLLYKANTRDSYSPRRYLDPGPPENNAGLLNMTMWFRSVSRINTGCTEGEANDTSSPLKINILRQRTVQVTEVVLWSTIAVKVFNFLFGLKKPTKRGRTLLMGIRISSSAVGNVTYDLQVYGYNNS